MKPKDPKYKRGTNYVNFLNAQRTFTDREIDRKFYKYVLTYKFIESNTYVPTDKSIENNTQVQNKVERKQNVFIDIDVNRKLNKLVYRK